jgi:hypothetical protein
MNVDVKPPTLHHHSAAAHAHVHERTSAGFRTVTFHRPWYRYPHLDPLPTRELTQGRTSRRAKALSFRVRVPSLTDCVRVRSAFVLKSNAQSRSFARPAMFSGTHLLDTVPQQRNHKMTIKKIRRLW